MSDVTPRLKFRRARIMLSALKNIATGRMWNISTLKAAPGELADYKYCISEFSLPIKERVELGEENRNRVINMKLACDTIDKTVLLPGKIFSLQALIGDPTPEKGYKQGPVVLEGKLGSSSGGGLCQISTVLFNAALLSDMEILEKYNHSVDVWGDDRLVGLGRDAVYAYALKDLKFKNSAPSPVLVRITADEGKKLVTSGLYSISPRNSEVIVETQVTDNLAQRKWWSQVIVAVKRVQTLRYVRAGDRKELTYAKVEYYDHGPDRRKEGEQWQQ